MPKSAHKRLLNKIVSSIEIVRKAYGVASQAVPEFFVKIGDVHRSLRVMFNCILA